MKKVLAIGAIMLLTAAISIALFDYFTGDPSYPESVIQTKFYSTILGEEREVIIHLPRNCDSTKKYPVMYVLDGSSEDGHVANKFDILSTAGYAPPAIVVGIPNMSGENRQRNMTPPYMRMDIDKKDSPLGGADKFLSFMESELFPFIENKYPASPVRLFYGNSRGGLLVMYSLLHKPDLFQARFCFSPAFWRDDNMIVSKAADFLSAKDTLHTFLYMSMGAKEVDKMKNGFDSMTRVFKEKAPIGLVWHSEYTANADHQDNAQISATIGIGRWSEYLKTK
jgi:predicted alpha/beta superfamily hydrolase